LGLGWWCVRLYSGESNRLWLWRWLRLHLWVLWVLWVVWVVWVVWVCRG
jgi:hypothetical protein